MKQQRDYRPYYNNHRNQPHQSEVTSSTSDNGSDKGGSTLFASSAASNIGRPILTDIGWIKVHQFAEAWKNYTFQVNSSEMEDKKKREALNITASISELVLNLLVDYDLVKMGILRPGSAGGRGDDGDSGADSRI